MSKDRDFQRDDIFMRGARLRARESAGARELHDETHRARAEDAFVALIAAVAVIAHADGKLELAERRTLVEAFIKSPAIKGFSVGDLAQELAEHSRAYGYDPHSAELRALSTLATSTISNEERLSIRQACHQVITADGLVHPVELGALHRVERALGLVGGTS
jgi:tellurite resistance protein